MRGPFRGKASGKTITLTAYLDWFEDATGINDSDPKEWHELRERIAELEAELRTECVHCGQPIPHVHKHESTRELALRLRAEKAEAEVERLSLLAQKPRENDENRRVSDDGLYVVSPASRKATPRTRLYNQATGEEVG